MSNKAEKSHPRSAAGALHTGTNTRGRGHGVTLLESCWSLEALRGSGGLLLPQTIAPFQQHILFMAEQYPTDRSQVCITVTIQA